MLTSIAADGTSSPARRSGPWKIGHAASSSWSDGSHPGYSRQKRRYRWRRPRRPPLCRRRIQSDLLHEEWRKLEERAGREDDSEILSERTSGCPSPRPPPS